MRSRHRGEELPHVARGEYCRDGRPREKTQHPPTHTHTSLLLRHYSSTVTASMEPNPLLLFITSISPCSSPNIHTQSLLLPLPSLSPLPVSQKALSVCCRMLQITSVYMHVQRKLKKSTEGNDIHASVVSHTHTHTPLHPDQEF